ncbi:MAG: phytanoyl-CoA dioxygenase, partial [Phycisphaeraceae bacterium]|nr:phytanoyl-CoA dioxygenase [Phycisphaeraceae bacterium]
MLSSAEVNGFRESGYMAVREAVDAQTLETLRNAADALLEESRSLTESDSVFELEKDHSAETPRLCRVSNPVTQQPVFWETATSDGVLDCVESLIGPDIKFHHSKLNMKAGGGGADIGWHQDFAFFPHTNFDLVACGIALDDSTLDNGCLLVVPGSHRGGTLAHRSADGRFQGRIVGDFEKFDPDAAEPVELKAGDMSIHHVGVIHGSKQNLSDRSRRLLIYQYAACDAIALDYRPPANEFASCVIRGAPPTHARLEGAMRLPLR